MSDPESVALSPELQAHNLELELAYFITLPFKFQ